MATKTYPIAFITHPDLTEEKKELIEFLEAEFDFQCAIEEQQINDLIAQHKYLKRYLLVKTLLFPIEYTLTKVFIDRLETKALYKRQVKIWRALIAKNLTKEEIDNLYGLVWKMF